MTLSTLTSATEVSAFQAARKATQAKRAAAYESILERASLGGKGALINSVDEKTLQNSLKSIDEAKEAGFPLSLSAPELLVAKYESLPLRYTASRQLLLKSKSLPDFWQAAHSVHKTQAKDLHTVNEALIEGYSSAKSKQISGQRLLKDA